MCETEKDMAKQAADGYANQINGAMPALWHPQTVGEALDSQLNVALTRVENIRKKKAEMVRRGLERMSTIDFHALFDLYGNNPF
jgi:hypothetical protein